MLDIIVLIPLLPLIGFLINGLFGKHLKNEKLIGIIASASVGISFILSIILFFDILNNHFEQAKIVTLYTWVSAGNFSIDFSYQSDQLSILFSLIITGVGFLIHVYSIGYMHGDRSFSRFFAYMNLFIFMMLNLVLSSNLLLTFLGWEGVGLCSYLLIGFWYDRKFDGVKIEWTGDAGNKAFIVNRIGDFGFLIAMFLIYLTFNSLEYRQISDSAMLIHSNYYDTGIITAITLLMFLACTGKSAQIPLAVWLPDAMAGPTPVSALIHAATMVTAGIFLIARNSVLFSLAPITMNIIAIIGIITCFVAATIGIVQNDIKKVLAYSTVSQLGYMFAALGVGAFAASVFHVLTHAFFKGLLFLAAGSIIHALHEQQNIKNMGGLKKYMPWTYRSFLIATFAIAGIPFFSGFFSKDEILWKVFSDGNWFLWLIAALTAFVTSFYMFRLLNLTFYGKERFNLKTIHPHESPKIMTIPLIALAGLSAIGGFLGIPYILGFWFSDHPNLIELWLNPIFKDALIILNNNHGHQIHFTEYLLMCVSIALAFAGMFIANKFYSDPNWLKPKSIAHNFKFLYQILWRKYFLDEIYFALIINPLLLISKKFLWKTIDVNIIDNAINGSASTTLGIANLVRRIQTGLIQNYALIMMTGIIIIIAFMILSI